MRGYPLYALTAASLPLTGGGAVANVLASSSDQHSTAGGDVTILTVDANGLAATGVTYGGTAAAFVALDATHILCVVPAKAAGSHAWQVTTPEGAGTTLSVEAWSPAEESLTAAAWAGNYQDTAHGTWAGRASAGASSGRDFVQSTAANRPIEVGLAPKFDGTNDHLTLAVDRATLLGGSGWSASFDVEIPELGADGGNFANQTLFSETGQYVALELFSNGARVLQYNAAGTVVTSATATGLTPGRHVIDAKWTGTEIAVRIDGGTWATAAQTEIGGTGTFVLGSNYNGSGGFLRGLLRHAIFADSVFSDTVFDKIGKWVVNTNAQSIDTKPEITRIESDVFDPAGGDRLVVHGRQLGGATDVRVGTTQATIVREAFAGTPEFDGASKLGGSAISAFVAADQFSTWFLIRPTAAHSSTGVIWGDSAGFLRFSLGASTTRDVGFMIYDGSTESIDTDDIPVGEWCLVQAKFAANVMAIRLVTERGIGSWVTKSSVSDIASLASAIVVGSAGASAFLNACVAEIAITKDSLSDSDLLDVIRDINAEYGLALGGEVALTTNRASLNLSGFWRRGQYSVGTWAGAASAGDSVGEDLSEVTDPPPLADSTILVCTAPAKAVGTYPIVVQTAAGWGTLADAVKYMTPASIADLVWWLDASLGVTVNGSDEVTTWADQSGAGDSNRDAVPATAGLVPYNASDLDYGGKPTIGPFVNATNRRLKTGAWSGGGYAGPYTINVLGHTPADASNRYFTTRETGTFNAILNQAGFPTVYGSYIAGVSLPDGSGGSLARKRSSATAIFRNATGEFHVGSTHAPGTGDLEGDESLNLGSSDVGIGSHPAGSSELYGAERIARIAAWSRALTLREIRDLRRRDESFYGPVAA